MNRFHQVMWLSALILLLAASGCDSQSSNGQQANVLPDVTATDGPSPTPPPTQTPEGTEDPDEGLIFETLTVIRTGGLRGVPLTVTLQGDGLLLVDEQALGQVAEEVVLDLDAQLDRMGFFRLENRYGPYSARSDTFEYEIIMTRNGMSASVFTVDGYIPPSLQQVIDTLLNLAAMARS